MNELREKILSELWVYKDANDEQYGIDATDRIIALVREVLLSEQAVEAVAKVLFSEELRLAQDTGKHAEGPWSMYVYRDIARAAIAAAGLGGQDDGTPYAMVDLVSRNEQEKHHGKVQG